jgi:hypothetical protein
MPRWRGKRVWAGHRRLAGASQSLRFTQYLHKKRQNSDPAYKIGPCLATSTNRHAIFNLHQSPSSRHR